MIKADYHTHTNASADADKAATMETMIERAIALGLDTIALTDHVDYQSDGTPYSYQIDYNRYIRQFNLLKEKYEGQIELILGVEMGLGAHLVTQFETMAAQVPFEFIIGSTHEIDRKDMYMHRTSLFKGRTKRQAYGRYLAATLENIKLCPFFHVYGHLDYVPRYGVYDDNTMPYTDFREPVDAILKALVESGKGLEVNTSGLRYGLGHMHPQLSILKRYRVLGGDIVTVGSDAHTPALIADHFDHAAALLEAAGFTAYTIFKSQKPVWVDL